MFVSRTKTVDVANKEGKKGLKRNDNVLENTSKSRIDFAFVCFLVGFFFKLRTLNLQRQH